MGKTSITSCVAMAVVFLLSVWSMRAEAVKLRHISSFYTDEKEVGLHAPQGVGCGNKAHIVVADTGNGRLVRFAFQDGKVTESREIKVPQLTTPIRVQINSRGEIFALDGRQQRVVRLSAGGQFEGYVEAAGLPAPATIVPRNFAIDRRDTIYLLDLFADRVLILSPEGKYVKQIGLPAEYGFISDLTVDDNGDIYLVDSVMAMVFMAGKEAQRFAPLGNTMKQGVKFPASITTDGRGTLFVVDKNAGVVVMVGLDGALQGQQLQMGWTEGLLYYPEQVCINHEDKMFIADRGNNRVQMFELRR